MKTIINPYIEKNGWELSFTKAQFINQYNDYMFYAIDVKTSPTEWTLIACLNTAENNGALVLYYRLPWIVINKIYKYLDKEAMQNDI